MKFKPIHLILLNVLLMVYSLSSVCSKLAAGESFLSLRFCLFYGGVILLLGVYAIFWQQLIGKLPLTLAYANKAVTVFWGMVWGVFFFREKIQLHQILGAGLIVAGVVLFAFSEGKS